MERGEAQLYLLLVIFFVGAELDLSLRLQILYEVFLLHLEDEIPSQIESSIRLLAPSIIVFGTASRVLLAAVIPAGLVLLAEGSLVIGPGRLSKPW